MLTDCDTCRYLDECNRDPQKQLVKCWRYEDFLGELNKAISNIPVRENNFKGQYCPIVRRTCQEGICKDCAAGRMEIIAGRRTDG